MTNDPFRSTLVQHLATDHATDPLWMDTVHDLRPCHHTLHKVLDDKQEWVHGRRHHHPRPEVVRRQQTVEKRSRGGGKTVGYRQEVWWEIPGYDTFVRKAEADEYAMRLGIERTAYPEEPA